MAKELIAGELKKNSGCVLFRGHSAFLSLIHDGSNDEVEDREDRGSDESGSKGSDIEAGNESAGEAQNEGIDDEKEEPKGENGEREGDDFQEQPERGVQQSDYERGNERGGKTTDVKTRNHLGDDQQCQRVEEPAQKETEHFLFALTLNLPAGSWLDLQRILKVKMLPPYLISLCVFLCAAAGVAQQDPPPIPDPATLLAQVARHQRELDATRESYTWNERVVIRMLDKKGDMKKTRSEEDNIFFVNSHEIRRKVSKDGKELDQDQQKKEQERVAKEVEKAENTPPGQSIDKNMVSITQLLSIMKTSRPRRDTIDGRSAIAFDFTGDPHAKTHGLAEDASKKISGTLWVDEKDREVRRMIARFDDNFHLGFGLFSVGKGSNFTFNQTLVNGQLWLPVGAEAHILGHAVGLIGYRAEVNVSDADYQRFHAKAIQAPAVKVVNR